MKYMIITILIVLALLTLTKKDTNNTMTLLDNNTILAFGDSLTYGYGAKANESYPSILSDLTHIHVLNAGVNGETSDAGVRRLPQLLQNTSIKLMILCFGGNDILQKRSISSLKQNLKTMIQMAKAKNIEVLLVSVPNLSLLGLSPLALYEEVAEEENIPLLDGVLSTILSDLSLKSDQIHPNALGYKMMADTIYTHLKAQGWIAE